MQLISWVHKNCKFAARQSLRKIIIDNVPNKAETEKHLLRLEKEYGGAWTYSNIFGQATFYQFATPSSIPDSFHDGSFNTIAYLGKLQDFTTAARRREQNRGLGCE